MRPIPVYFDVDTLSAHWKVLPAFILEQARSGRLARITTAAEDLYHRDHVKTFERLYHQRLYRAQVEKEVYDITLTQQELDLFPGHPQYLSPYPLPRTAADRRWWRKKHKLT